MLCLFWANDMIIFFSCIYIWIENIYDSDDQPLTQMILQRTTRVNTEDEDAKDEEDDENYKKMSNEGANEVRFSL